MEKMMTSFLDEWDKYLDQYIEAYEAKGAKKYSEMERQNMGLAKNNIYAIRLLYLSPVDGVHA